MSISLDLNDVGNIIDATTAQATINANNAAIEAAFANALNTSSSQGNQMSTALDMNSNAIVNLPVPISLTSPLRLTDANTLNGGGTITGLPAGGLTGQALVKTSNTNYITGWASVPTAPGTTVINDIVTWNATDGTVIKDSGIQMSTVSTLNNSQVLSNKTIDTAAPNTIKINGNTLAATAGTAILTFPNTTDTIVGRATTDALTNKTFNAAVGGNVFQINSNTISSNTGTGAVNVLATSPTLVTPVLGAATGTSLQLSGLTASSAVATDGSKNLVSVTNTGSGNNVLATSPTLGTSLTFSPTTGGIVGTPTNDNASATIVGEYLSSGMGGGSNTATVTITIASPAVITWTGLPFFGITPIRFTTTGALPTGLAVATTYWTIPATVGTNTFQLATSIANALAGTPINTSGTQSGVQTATINIPLTNNVSVSGTAMSLTAGDWDVYGMASYDGAAATTLNYLNSGLSRTDNAFDATTLGASATSQTYGGVTPFATLATLTQTFGPHRVSLSTTTTIYGILTAGFGVSTNNGYAFIRARRIR